MFFSKSRQVIGLDIGSSYVKAVELRETGRKGYSVVNFGITTLPPEAIVDGTIMNQGAVVDAITELMGQFKTKLKDVAISISGNAVIIKKISMPSMTKEELDEAIQWEAEQYIPFDVRDVNLDVQVLSPEGDQSGQMDVLLVAAKKELINEYTAMIAETGLTPVIVDVDVFALEAVHKLAYEQETETIALVNIGANVININVLAGGVSVFHRDIAQQGGNQFTEEIQKQLSVSYDEAEAWKTGGGLGQMSQSVVPQEVETILQQVSESVAAEIHRTLDFFTNTAGDEQITRVYLSGGSAKVATLPQVLENKLSASWGRPVPVELLDPFNRLTIDVDGLEDQAYRREVAPFSAIAVGLASRQVGDGRINLLPFKEKEKVRSVQQQLVFGAMGVGATLLVVLAIHVYYKGLISEQKDSIARLEGQIKQMEKLEKEVKTYRDQIAEFERKIAIIEDLNTKKSGPVHMMDQLAQATPEKLWLTSANQSGSILRLEGYAISNEVVSDFMNALEDTKNNLQSLAFFTNIEFDQTELVKEQKQRSDLMKFGLQVEIAYRSKQP